MNEARAVAALDAAGVPYELVRHGRVGSLREAAEVRGLDPSQVIKSIVVRRGDDDFLFVLVPGGRQIAWPKLRAVLGVSRLSMPDAETALAVTGYERGTITPFGSLTQLPVIIDSRIMDIDRRKVSIGAGAHGVAAILDAGRLGSVLDATVADVTAGIESETKEAGQA